MSPSIEVFVIEGIGEVRPGDDIADLLMSNWSDIRNGDIVVVTSKIISKAEGRFVSAAERERAIGTESVRVVASRTVAGHTTTVVEHRLGLVMAAAGVDSSNVPDGYVLLLPKNPDASARSLASRLRRLSGAQVGVLVTDTFGRPWRRGQTDVVIGAAGVRVLDDLRGSRDANGKLLKASIPCVGDELAAAADLVKGKNRGYPVAVVRGRQDLVGSLELSGALAIVRDPTDDMFTFGTQEAMAKGFREGWNAAMNTRSDLRGGVSPS